MGVCGGSAGGMVAGRIVDGNGENVESVSVAVNGADDKTMTTAADGYYQFELPMGGDYTVTPEKDICLLYTSPSPRDQRGSRMPSSA